MIRMAKIADVAQILEIYAPYVENTTVSFEYEVPTLAAFTRRFENITEQFPWLVWEEDGRIFGYAYASAPFTRAAYQWCAEPTVYLRPEARGRGIAARLYDVLEDILARQGYAVLYALVCGENTPSIHFHQKQGYQVRAQFPDIGFKMGRGLSLYWFEKRLKMVKTPSNSPCKWSDIVQDAESPCDNLDKLSIP